MQGRLRNSFPECPGKGNIGVHFVAHCVSTYTPVICPHKKRRPHVHREGHVRIEAEIGVIEAQAKR